ncbi:hypothetical protein BCR44DRAFT_1175439 [Catenaria anguillulae PL171]|uniref:Secreted protein n=1 Tax=Catenaria anguillulae PL171 TaxID=765915 RepID=A0A1Y2I0U8_9FUNG|nr:hypothetical protein BCR44DRAFT_1175439 [Catenaria anguillulae PL171]
MVLSSRIIHVGCSWIWSVAPSCLVHGVTGPSSAFTCCQFRQSLHQTHPTSHTHSNRQGTTPRAATKLGPSHTWLSPWACRLDMSVGFVHLFHVAQTRELTGPAPWRNHPCRVNDDLASYQAWIFCAPHLWGVARKWETADATREGEDHF